MTERELLIRLCKTNASIKGIMIIYIYFTQYIGCGYLSDDNIQLIFTYKLKSTYKNVGAFLMFQNGR